MVLWYRLSLGAARFQQYLGTDPTTKESPTMSRPATTVSLPDHTRETYEIIVTAINKLIDQQVGAR